MASDNTFLGVISDSLNEPDSIANPAGTYGDFRSPYCLWNVNGYYGAEEGDDSPWDEDAKHPPAVFYGDQFWCYLSTNPSFYPRIDPYWLAEYVNVDLW